MLLDDESRFARERVPRVGNQRVVIDALQSAGVLPP
jgi:hypothetical protein